MDNLNTIETMIIDLSDTNSISTKIAAVNSNVRFAILEVLRDFQKVNKNKEGLFEKDPLYSREINSILLKDYNISITPQMIGDHLKKLVEAGLIEQVIIKKEVPNKIGKRNVKAYTLKIDAFEELFLEISFFADELLTYFNLYKSNQEYLDGTHCVLTVFNGVDKGKTFTISKDETILIGRKSNFDLGDIASFTMLLDNSYASVSSVSKPHLKIFYQDNHWCVLDESSTNGTFILDKKIPKGKVTRLRNNTFLKLSKGNGSAVIYCSFQ